MNIFNLNNQYLFYHMIYIYIFFLIVHLSNQSVPNIRSKELNRNSKSNLACTSTFYRIQSTRILNLLIKPGRSESTFLSAKSTRRSNTSVYSNFVFRRCIIYKRLASIEAKFISTSTRSKELDHRARRKIDCRYTIGITCWVSCFKQL